MGIVRALLTLIHTGILILLLATTLNAVVPPRVFPYLNLLSLGFPVLLLVHLGLCFWWLLRLKRRAIFFAAATLLILQPIRRWVNWTGQNETAANLKVVSMNIKGGEYGYPEIYEYLESQQADLVLVQEFGTQFKLPGHQYQVTKYPIVAVSSRTEILKTEKIATTGNGNSFYADVRVNGQTIRVINAYLNPFSFDKGTVKPTESLGENKVKVKYILKRLIPTFKIHQQEVADLRRAVEQSPHPVLLAGDFNSVPNSYEYYQLTGSLTDAFVAAGQGLGTSFHDYKFPIRIDYIFSSPEITPVNYRVDRNVHLSDHFPVIAEFNLKSP